MGYRAQNLANMAKAAAPTMLGFFGVIVLMLPLRLFEGLVPTPIIPLVVVFFWSIYAPSYMPSVSVFLIGLLQDILTGGPLGLWALVYLITQYVVMSQRAYFMGREQRVVWLGFVLAALSASFLLWFIMSLMSGERMPVMSLAGQVIATILIYPLVGFAFRELHHRVLQEA